ncbi:hypothetical protein BD413DRAFT_608774 [Trametes elegans]|nr:hypothetical protein BD413DRAFT_608774 [Trametes elegans]
MLSLPQSAPQEAEPIRMEESAEVLAALLSIVCGVEAPDLDNADLLQSVLAAADKYEIPMPVSVLRTALFSPIRLFGLAARMSWGLDAPALFADIFHRATEQHRQDDEGGFGPALRAPPGVELGPAFFCMPELTAMYTAKCAKCK